MGIETVNYSLDFVGREAPEFAVMHHRELSPTDFAGGMADETEDAGARYGGIVCRSRTRAENNGKTSLGAFELKTAKPSHGSLVATR